MCTVVFDLRLNKTELGIYVHFEWVLLNARKMKTRTEDGGFSRSVCCGLKLEDVLLFMPNYLSCRMFRNYGMLKICLLFLLILMV